VMPDVRGKQRKERYGEKHAGKRNAAPDRKNFTQVDMLCGRSAFTSEGNQRKSCNKYY